MGRLRAMMVVASFAWACVAEFPATEPPESASRKPGNHEMDLGWVDLGSVDLGSVGDQDVIDQRRPEPEPQPAPQPEPAPDMLSQDEGVLDAAPPPPPVPDMAPPPVPFVRFDAVASGRNFACGRRAVDQRVLCWGQNNHGQLNAPNQPLTPFGLGYDQGCGYDADAFVIRCWGRNDRGQAHPGTPSFGVREFRGGDQVTCGLTDLAFACLGEDSLRAGEIGALRSIGVGKDHICAFKLFDDRPFCWGDSREGRHAVPEDLLSPDSLVGSETQTCGRRLVGNTIACWGPGPEPPPGDFRQLFPSAGQHLCAINSGGETVCWGDDSEGQATPPAGVIFTQLAGGADHTCGLDTDGRIHCWGRNNHRQLQVPTP
ncbi:MAG: hypothetical protein ACI9U2_001154 [Bradymonadia bacterium]|jgi:hypothetical protein